jgi:hypothetical protein
MENQMRAITFAVFLGVVACGGSATEQAKSNRGTQNPIGTWDTAFAPSGLEFFSSGEQLSVAGPVLYAPADPPPSSEVYPRHVSELLVENLTSSVSNETTTFSGSATVTGKLALTGVPFTATIDASGNGITGSLGAQAFSGARRP